MLAPSTSPAEAPSRPGKPLIFVVDDEAVIGEVVEVILNLEGYESRFFQNPKDALQELEAAAEPPALILTDFAMGPLNGMELLEQARKRYPDLKVILYSGNVGHEVLQRYTVHPNAFLAKPFLPKTLTSLIERVLAEQPTAVA